MAAVELMAPPSCSALLFANTTESEVFFKVSPAQHIAPPHCEDVKQQLFWNLMAVLLLKVACPETLTAP
ncbi:hypothetical protein CP10139811_0003 [Chlamydia ibidis]|uniref:Uncharacterized protein n=1 Tax=Chlamydia ibidis TaxID=1405396 RepID=S7KMN0_9CHLA|nr:hypothetical protein CP10139811_0003 [Chlamydia ibidis]